MIQNKTYSIEGMSCGSCAVSIEMLLANQPGVKSATVRFDNKEAVIGFERGEFNFDQVKKTISQMGYKLMEK